MNVIFMPQQRNSCCNNLYYGSAPQRNKHLKHFEVFWRHRRWWDGITSGSSSAGFQQRPIRSSGPAGHKSLEFRSSFIKVVSVSPALIPGSLLLRIQRALGLAVLRTCGTEVTKRLRARTRTLPDCRKEGRGYMMSPGGCDLTTRWAPAAPASQETPD